MKKQFIICLSILFLLPLCVYGTTNRQLKWINTLLDTRLSLQKKKQTAGLPMETPWIQARMEAYPVVADIKGLSKLVLVTDGGPDGTGSDHAVWANARLIKADGTVVWLDSLTPEYAVAGWQVPLINQNYAGNPLRVGGKKYEHGILCHADGIMVYPLDDSYIRFEAEVGIEEGSGSGTVYFKVLPFFAREIAGSLLNEYPAEIGAFTAAVPFDKWLSAEPGSVELEREAAGYYISKLKEPAWFRKELSIIDKEKTNEVKRFKYLELFDRAAVVFNLQTDLEWLNTTALQMAFEHMKKQKGFEAGKLAPMVEELVSLCGNGFDTIYQGDESAIDNAQKALRLKRTILLSNPLLEMDKIVATRFHLGSDARSVMAPALGTQQDNWSNQMSAAKESFNAEIVLLSELKEQITSNRIYKPEGTASLADLKIHWNGDKVMFTSVMPDGRWNVFEVNIDGSGFKPLVHTPEPDLEFFDGAWLPDGRIIVNSNIGYQGVPCVHGGDLVGNMVLFDPATENLRRLTFDQDANWNPVIMNNGRVMYTRWEYTDLTHYYSRIVMHMNPDGTENKALFGSGSMFPNSIFDEQPLPGHSSAFIGVISGHHGVARSGRLILFDPSMARKGTEGMIQEIPFRNRKIIPLVKDELVDDVWPQFIKPYPLDDSFFLVAGKLSPDALWGIYLVDVFDNVTPVVLEEGVGYISPQPVRAVKTPPVIPDRVKLNEKESTIFIQDIYEGEGLRGVPRGTVKSIRVMAYEYAYGKSPSDHIAQGIQSGWDIKRLLGVVPVEEDGSAIFKIPANTPVSLQPLDEEGSAIQWMRSWFTGMPGEIVSCVGCHEDQNMIPIPKRVTASTKSPSSLQIAGGSRPFTFDLEVQPVLDRACVACHNGDGELLDFTGGKKDRHTGFGQAYLNLHPFVKRQGPEADIVVLQPYEYHVSNSELIRMLKKGHHQVELTDSEWQVLYNWIDFNAPDKSTFTDHPLNGFNQYDRRQELNNKYANGSGVDWKKEIQQYKEYLEKQGEIKPVLPVPAKESRVRKVEAKNWPLNKDEVSRLSGKEKENRKEIEIAPGVKIPFVRIPAGQFVMGSSKGDRDNQPESRVKISRAFWMSETEITNEQYNVLFPEHDSRYVDQLWKDHTNPGYPANLPHQPVIRINWEEAMEYGHILSQKTGLNITLPTEAQWEWACRAGSDRDFWFGDLGSDFSTKENLADYQLINMAVSGVDPQPMDPSEFWFPYYNYLPREATVDDGQMIQCDSRLYEANPFGLYGMHGNVAEWTRSSYLPYPYKEKTPAEEISLRVVRGGSYIDRPQYATAYTRKPFYAWQRVSNVGFRLIIED